jgi:hypothetical protein
MYGSFRSEAGGLTIVSLRHNPDEPFVNFSVMQLTNGRWWRCSSFGPDGVLPDVTLHGKDQVRIAASIPAADFTWCDEGVDVVDFTLDFAAGVVLHQRESSVTTVVKGDPQYYPSTLKIDRWIGDDVVVAGEFLGDSVTGTSYARFTWQKTILASNS